eukprot:c3349_g1_i1.p1 GENE.c3349_g1_i1~~c3349_g1_i1.p1  ORF type:complete len:182 (+),score=45.31 c3349_g1_i1:56-601(+)
MRARKIYQWNDWVTFLKQTNTTSTPASNKTTAAVDQSTTKATANIDTKSGDSGNGSGSGGGGKPIPILDEPYKYHAFFTHDWGTDELGRSNHDRVVEIAKQCTVFGLRIWIDDEMTGNIRRQMQRGIDESVVVVVFITQRYINKVENGEGKDNCELELDYEFPCGTILTATSTSWSTQSLD